ncbi:MAG: hypothetical protein OXH69_13770 [Acidobacteria bacterium]|nr:hypothetical protein [Acidobacteriota bacterium]
MTVVSRGIHSGRAMVLCLVGVGGSLLIVGIESSTFLRHVFQIAPLAIVLAFAVRQQPWTAPAALGLFGCWAFFMGLIWLYLAGIQTTFTGNFTPFEIALTLIIGVSCVAGIIACKGVELTMGRWRRLLISTAFVGLQVGIMWLSLFGHRITHALRLD